MFICNSKKLMNEIIRVLREDGRLVILVPGEKGYEKDDYHKKFYNMKLLQKFSEDYNFTLKKARSVPLPFTSKILGFFCFFVVLIKN